MLSILVPLIRMFFREVFVMNSSPFVMSIQEYLAFDVGYALERNAHFQEKLLKLNLGLLLGNSG